MKYALLLLAAVLGAVCGAEVNQRCGNQRGTMFVASWRGTLGGRCVEAGGCFMGVGIFLDSWSWEATVNLAKATLALPAALSWQRPGAILVGHVLQKCTSRRFDSYGRNRLILPGSWDYHGCDPAGSKWECLDRKIEEDTRAWAIEDLALRFISRMKRQAA
jgi:hypothetical protein